MVVELCLLGRELVHRSRQEAELVPLWVGENHPRHVRSLAHVDPTSAESEQSVELLSQLLVDEQTSRAAPGADGAGRQRGAPTGWCAAVTRG